MNSTIERRIIVVNAAGIARPTPVVTHRQFLAWLPAVWCAHCEGDIPQDLARHSWGKLPAGAPLLMF